ncbi:MAG: hypothetical protein ABIS36_00085 [Chryseolinea sp.]
MKTSNIILTSLFGSITFFFLAGFTDLRINGTRSGDQQTGASIEKEFSSTRLSPVKYVVINEATNLIIKSGSQTELVVKIGTEDKDPILQHHLSGDTLFIDKIAFGDNGITLTAELKLNPENLNWIKASHSAFSISNMRIDGLMVDLYSSRLSVNSNQNIKSGRLKINAANSSDFNTSNIEFDSVNVTLDHSAAFMDGAIHDVNAELRNESSLSVPQADNITSHKDKSSRIN